MTQAAGRGTVIAPEFNTDKIDLTDLPLEVKVVNVSFKEDDDCIFVLCSYPDGFKKNHQLFKPIRITELYHQMIGVFFGRYGKHVEPTSTPPIGDPTNHIATFKEA